jgi:hypothetical protein
MRRGAGGPLRAFASLCELVRACVGLCGALGASASLLRYCLEFGDPHRPSALFGVRSSGEAAAAAAVAL